MTIIPPPQATATLTRAAATIVEHVRAILKVHHPRVSPHVKYILYCFALMRIFTLQATLRRAKQLGLCTLNLAFCAGFC